MGNKAKKMAVFMALQKQSEAIQLPDLLKILGPAFAERSVRRWLSEWAQNGQVEKIGQKRGTRYRVIVENKNVAIPAGKSFEFSRHVQTALEQISIPLFQRNPITYNTSWIDAYQPNHTLKEYTVLVDAMGFNEARVRFRKELRSILRDIILKKLSKKRMQQYIENTIHKNIPTAFQMECIKVIYEEIENMGPERIHGLGVTQQELNAWNKLLR